MNFNVVLYCLAFDLHICEKCFGIRIYKSYLTADG